MVEVEDSVAGVMVTEWNSTWLLGSTSAPKVLRHREIADPQRQRWPLLAKLEHLPEN